MFAYRPVWRSHPCLFFLLLFLVAFRIFAALYWSSGPGEVVALDCVLAASCNMGCQTASSWVFSIVCTTICGPSQ